MLVFADAQALQSPATVERGIGRYVSELANAVEHGHPGAIAGWVLRPDYPVPTHIPALVSSARFRLQDDPDVPPPDVWHATSPFESLLEPVDRLWPTWARGPRTRLVATLYDLIPLHFPERYLAEPRVRRAYMSRLQIITRADRVQAISEATAHDAVKHLRIPAHRIDVVGTGVSPSFVPPSSADAALEHARRHVPGLRASYVMYTGGIDFRKSIDGLLLAYSMLPGAMRAEHQLVIVCRVLDSEREHLEQQARSLGIEDDLLLTGFVPDPVLLSLYQAAHLFVFPSLYEGFGLPVVEALACGVPAIVGANSSLIELVPDPQAHFDAASPDAISRAIFTVLNDDDLRTSLRDDARSSVHRWSLVAERTLESYAAARARHVSVSALPRVALVSPMPPASSGVADYSLALLEELRAIARVDVFTSPEADRPSLSGVEWYAYDDFDGVERMRGHHDARLFAMGNSEHHIDVLRLLRAKGGTVMAHDVRYTGLLARLQQCAPGEVDPGTAELLAAMHAGRRPAALSEHVSMTAESYFTLNGLLCAPALTGATKALVHSPVAAMLARANLPADRRPIVEVVPFGHTLRRIDPDRPRDVVASFGIVHSLKESATVCAAFIELARRHPHLTFAIVGEVVDDDMREQLGAMLAQAGLGGSVRLTGRVAAAEYDDWLARAAVAVQLRAHSNGESSAAVADCLGAGAAVVTSRTGTMASLTEVTRIVEPGVSVAELVATVEDLLSHPGELAELALRGRAHAEASSFSSAASSVLAAALERSPVRARLG